MLLLHSTYQFVIWSSLGRCLSPPLVCKEDGGCASLTPGLSPAPGTVPDKEQGFCW